MLALLPDNDCTDVVTMMPPQVTFAGKEHKTWSSLRPDLADMIKRAHGAADHGVSSASASGASEVSSDSPLTGLVSIAEERVFRLIAALGKLCCTTLVVEGIVKFCSANLPSKAAKYHPCCNSLLQDLDQRMEQVSGQDFLGSLVQAVWKAVSLAVPSTWLSVAAKVMELEALTGSLPQGAVFDTVADAKNLLAVRSSYVCQCLANLLSDHGCKFESLSFTGKGPGSHDMVAFAQALRTETVLAELANLDRHMT